MARYIQTTILALLLVTAVASGQNLLEELREGAQVEGFVARARYLNDQGVPMGARFEHVATGFTLDVIRMPSVPQAQIWVNSFPTSNMGEPHTQEHLLLGKGNKGRAVASMEEALLVGSSAFTMQWRTVYHFHTSAGTGAFFRALERQLDALLHPDYTDEEIRREVAHIGVSANADGTLTLEEKGTVYNEMVSSFERSWSRTAYVLGAAVYGPTHPLALSSGGYPDSIRSMRPEDIRRFHAANYHLSNMGMVAALPREIELREALARLGAMLSRLEADGGRALRPMRLADLPKPMPAPVGSIIVTEYPNRNAAQPGPVLLTWPADLALDLRGRLLLSFFLGSVAGDATTNLYKRLVDSRTRTINLGANGVFAWADSDPGNSVTIGVSNVGPEHLNDRDLAVLRDEVLKELRAISEMNDGSEELRAFNDRVVSRILERRRQSGEMLNAPPGFGFRGSGAEWMERLRELESLPDFDRRVTGAPLLDELVTAVTSPRNIWRGLIEQWRLLERVPYVGAARPSPALADREARARAARLKDAVATLRSEYGGADDRQTIERFRVAYDADTRVLDSIAALVPVEPFVADPPMTLDDQLAYRVDTLARGVPMLVASFPDMTSGSAGIAFRLDGVPYEYLTLLSLLPELLTETGVIDGNGPVPYEEMSERLRRDVLGVSAWFSSNHSTGRVELTFTASGADTAEAARALEWTLRMLTSPLWRESNLGRIRDLVDQRLSDLRTTMQGSEESWVQNPAWSLWRQDSPLLLTTTSFLTRTFNVLKIKWLLRDDDGMGDLMQDYLGQVGAAAGGASRAELVALSTALTGDAGARASVGAAHRPLLTALDAMPAESRELVAQAGHDLLFVLNDIPDESLLRDWNTVLTLMRRGLQASAVDVLGDLDSLRRLILRAGGARTWIVGAPQAHPTLRRGIERIAASLSDAPARSGRAVGPGRVITGRVMARTRTPIEPEFLGLVSSSSSSGVFVNMAEATSYRDTSRALLLDYLASSLYGGGGGHGIFMKTWGAGLAYSNGLRISPRSGVITYYAERVPSLPQTLTFVIGELKRATVDPSLRDYAIAQAFRESRAASTFEARARAMADDLADGLTPETVRRFRSAILALRDEPGLIDSLYARLPSVVSRVLPGYLPIDSAGRRTGAATRPSPARTTQAPRRVNFVVGPESQLERYEGYLKSIGAPALVRLWPRDYWME